jgi:hypothetical protein
LAAARSLLHLVRRIHTHYAQYGPPPAAELPHCKTGWSTADVSSGSTPFQKNSVCCEGETGGPGTTQVELISLTEPPPGALTCAHAFQAEPWVAFERRKGCAQRTGGSADAGRTQEACIKPPGTKT